MWSIDGTMVVGNRDSGVLPALPDAVRTLFASFVSTLLTPFKSPLGPVNDSRVSWGELERRLSAALVVAVEEIDRLRDQVSDRLATSGCAL